MREKVVGTTFEAPIRFDDIAGKHMVSQSDDKLPYIIGEALLMPEPTNKYDSSAVAVIAKLANGKAAKIGYLPRGSQLQDQTTNPTMAALIAYGYSTKGSYNDSYMVDTDLLNK